MTETKDPQVLLGVLNTLREGVYVTDLDRAIIYWNQGASDITGYSREEVVGNRCRDNILEHVDKQGGSLCKSGCPLTAAMNSRELVETEGYLTHKSGHRVPVYIRTAPVTNSEGRVVGACEVFGDISARIAHDRKLKELQQLAMLDHLTQLANRRYTETSLAERLAQVRLMGVSVGVILYDIDHFKQVNDTHGHQTGDQVIRMVANTLLASSRPPDLIGRWGGEEFLQLLPNITANILADVCNRNRLLIAKSRLQLDRGKGLEVTASLGATLMKQEDDLGSLYKRVDGLLYKSKQEGRNRVSIG